MSKVDNIILIVEISNSKTLTRSNELVIVSNNELVVEI